MKDQVSRYADETNRCENLRLTLHLKNIEEQNTIVWTLIICCNVHRPCDLYSVNQESYLSYLKLGSNEFFLLMTSQICFFFTERELVNKTTPTPVV